MHMLSAQRRSRAKGQTEYVQPVVRTTWPDQCRLLASSQARSGKVDTLVSASLIPTLTSGHSSRAKKQYLDNYPRAMALARRAPRKAYRAQTSEGWKPKTWHMMIQYNTNQDTQHESKYQTVESSVVLNPSRRRGRLETPRHQVSMHQQPTQIEFNEPSRLKTMAWEDVDVVEW